MSTSKYLPWYKSALWQRRRRQQLLCFPICELCLTKGSVVPAVIADHDPPHRGDYNTFALGTLQSLCKLCHDGKKRRMETLGFDLEVGEDGWPLDPNHPTHSRKREDYSSGDTE